MAEEKIFCGLVSPKFEGQLLAVKLDVDVLSSHVYKGKDRDGNAARFVDINVRLSQKGAWYAEIDTYQKGNHAPAAPPEAAPVPRPAEAPPVEDVVDDSIPF